MVYVQQTTNSDCGAASLAMVLRYHGSPVPLEELQRHLELNRDGANAKGLIETAGIYSLDGTGVSLGVADLDALPSASILHWDFEHFVVFERFDGRSVRIVDPARGRQQITLEEFGARFTGVALVFEPGEGFQTRRLRVDKTWSYFRRVLADSDVLIKVFVVSCILQVVGLGLPILTGMLVDRVLPDKRMGLLYILTGSFALLVAYRFVCTLLRNLMLTHLSNRVDAKMTSEFLDHLLDLPLTFFKVRSTGDLIMRVSSNSAVRGIVTSSTLSGTLDGILVVTYLVVILMISPTIGLIVLGLGLLRVAVYLASWRRVRELMDQELACSATLSGYQVQFFNGIETLKGLGLERLAYERWLGYFVDVLNVRVSKGRLDAGVQALIDGLSFGSPIVILLVGTKMTIEGDMSLGTMLALNALAAGFLAPVSSLINSGIAFQQLGSYVERLDDVLVQEKEQDASQVQAVEDLAGNVELRGVSFRYSSFSPWIVRDIDLTIHAGQQIAIVGRSGAGKSTLAGLILGLYRPTSGQVFFDGRPLAELDLKSVRRRVGAVSQSTHLFGGTILNNITMDDVDVSMEAVVAAAMQAQVHEEIMAMPLNYRTLLSPDGQSLSGGQRQRIAIARALVRSPAILVFDEATSSLDVENEAKVQRALDSLGCTRIVIAHRLSTIRHSDVIVVIDDGRIVESGTHVELLAKRGHYAELVSGQQ
ncbi:MAG: peptidase domain-containing ABC transporter [bacterium]|nr:peptidase domain-containing ABC transporter [bacterium]